MASRARLLAVFLMLAAMLTGCWSRIELNDLGIVLGMAVDVGEADAIRLTLAMPRPLPQQEKGGSPAVQEPVWVVAREAHNFTDALGFIRMASARRLVFHHLRVVLISEEYARKYGVGDVLDTLTTDQQIRLTVRPFVVEGRAQEVLETVPQLRSFQPTNLIGILHARGGAEWRLKNVMVARASETHTMWMPVVRVIQRPARTDQSPPTAVELSGAALFRRDYLQRIVHQPEYQVLPWFVGNPAGATISAPCPDPDKGTFSATVLSGKVRIRPEMRDNQVAFRVEVTGQLNLVRSQCGLGKGEAPESRRVLEEAMADDLRVRVERFIATLQESGTDPVGFGKMAQLAFPTYFKNLHHRWLEEWQRAPVTVVARVIITQSGLSTAPAHPTERELQDQEKQH